MGAALELTAGQPVEPQQVPVGRRSTVLIDEAREGRLLGVEMWYPASASGQPLTSYELFPGASFTSAGAQHEAAVRSGQYPLVVFSHGRTGMRFAYAMLCEALAARGAVVVSADHPGDALFDWLLGTHTDDRTNEVNRVADAHLVLDAFLAASGEVAAAGTVPTDVAAAIDHTRVVLAGHSYGAFTAFATAAGSRGVAAHPKVQAVVGLQPYTSVMSDGLLGRIDVPALMVISTDDTSTPPATNAERPWDALAGRPLWRLDLVGGAHQACSDVPLYAELAAHIPGLPDIARDYLQSAAIGTAEVGGRTWQQVLQLQVAAIWSFLQVALGDDPIAGSAAADRLGELPGLVLRRK